MIASFSGRKLRRNHILKGAADQLVGDPFDVRSWMRIDADDPRSQAKVVHGLTGKAGGMPRSDFHVKTRVILRQQPVQRNRVEAGEEILLPVGGKPIFLVG